MNVYRYFICFFMLLMFTSCQTENKPSPSYIKSQYTSRHNAPFSEATEYNGVLYLTGQIGKNHKTGQLIEGGIQAQTRQVLNNIKEVLEANNSDLDHVLKCTVILSDIDDFSAMNEIYRTFFKEHKPARTTFGANLVGDAKIEIDVIAAKK